MMIDPSIARQFERLPPHSVESEMCYIASLILSAGIDRERLVEMRRALVEDDFFQADHQILFKVIAGFIDRDKPFDPMILREELQRRQLLEEIGGTEYLAAILDSVPNFANGLQYAAEVRYQSVLRQGIAIANDILRDAYSPRSQHEESPEQLMRRHGERLGELAVNHTLDTTISLVDAAIKVIERRNKPEVRRLRTWLMALDEIIGGLPMGKTTMIGSDPRVGKSALVKQMLMNIAGLSGENVGIVTIEEDEQKVAENMLSNQTGINNFQISQDKLSADQWDKIELATVDLAKNFGERRAMFWIDPAPSTLSQVIASVERLALKYKCRAIAVDHLHLIRWDGDGRASREMQISEISKALKHAFKRLKVAGVVCVQLNRDKDVSNKPRLDNLRGSGDLEANADLVMLLYRSDVVNYQKDDFTPNHILEVNIAKNKDGRMGEIKLKSDMSHQLITDWIEGE